MFSFEDGAEKIINSVVNRYESHFYETFPLYEYIDMTSNSGYDFSVKGAEKLYKFVDRCIESDEPVKIPKGYNDRTY